MCFGLSTETNALALLRIPGTKKKRRKLWVSSWTRSAALPGAGSWPQSRFASCQACARYEYRRACLSWVLKTCGQVVDSSGDAYDVKLTYVDAALASCVELRHPLFTQQPFPRSFGGMHELCSTLAYRTERVHTVVVECKRKVPAFSAGCVRLRKPFFGLAHKRTLFMCPVRTHFQNKPPHPQRCGYRMWLQGEGRGESDIDKQAWPQ